MNIFSPDWLSRYREIVNADAEMQAIGEWFTVSLSLTCGEERSILRFERGRLVQIVESPRIDVRCAFGFRASANTWNKYLSRSPEPLYHDVFAMMMRVPGFVLEGDTLVAMQHARALHCAMKLMRKVPETRA